LEFCLFASLFDPERSVGQNGELAGQLSSNSADRSDGVITISQDFDRETG